jgi:ATP-dependent Clp protease ATP-binding subunit ClpC
MGQFSDQEGGRSLFHTLERQAAEPGPFPKPPELRVCRVLLLERVELAHYTARGALLQAMGGRWVGDGGRVLDFRNALLIMTTGVGREVPAGRRADEARSYADQKARFEGELSKEFRPEFLSRLDDVVVFGRLTREHLRRVLDLELARFAARLGGEGVALVVPAAVKEFLLDKGMNLELGVRSLRKAIEQHLEVPLTEELLKGTFAANKGPINLQIQEVRSLVFRPAT